jgi:hypothetical protein
MSTFHPSLTLVSERFGPLRDRAIRAFERDLISAICATSTRSARRRWPGHEESQRSSEAMRREYAALLLRVERELLRYLDEHPDGDVG